jgi:hypothetical protein
MSAALSEERSDLCGNPTVADCACHGGPWIYILQALEICRDEPEKVVDLLHPWDWPTILQRRDANVVTDSYASDVPIYYGMVLFVVIHNWPIRLARKSQQY